MFLKLWAEASDVVLLVEINLLRLFIVLIFDQVILPGCLLPLDPASPVNYLALGLEMIYTRAWGVRERHGRSLKLTLKIRPGVGSHVGVHLWVQVTLFTVLWVRLIERLLRTVPRTVHN